MYMYIYTYVYMYVYIYIYKIKKIKYTNYYWCIYIGKSVYNTYYRWLWHLNCFQVMSKQLTAGWAKRDKIAPDVSEETPKTPPRDDPKMEFLLATIDNKFDEFRREQLTLVPVPADKARLPNEQQQPVAGTSTESAHPVRRHRKRTQLPEPINSSARIHAKAKHQSLGTTAFVMGWVQFGNEVTTTVSV